MIDVGRLRVLVAFAEHGTLTRAAKALWMSQPTATHHLHRLAAETGATLVTRRGRTLVLTAEGEELARRGRGVLAELDRLDRDLAAMNRMESGTVRLASFPSATATLIPGVLTRLAERFPGLLLGVTAAEPPAAATALAEGTADLALTFTYGAGPAEPGTVLFRENLNLVLPAGDPLPAALPAGTTSILPADLAEFADRRWHTGCPSCRVHLMGLCEEIGFTPETGYSSDDYVAVQALVAAGHGVALLPDLALAAHRDPGVSVLRLRGRERDVRLVSRGREPLAPAVDVVVRTIRELASSWDTAPGR
ncbi:LysR family transcriptional regulator [Corynebacterium sp. P7202]|uniref:LysR family transcriptional regulator n=1 Tax=Corynebacterium pygosceleis TaxID=2800406 RepID=A0A9Q4GIS5_9CORY|nr:LysR family transcriptional regulator [Corynebacterium pygosceleis]MCK7637890.1 LysR family transcriptional regulator [Corynebacterium pygosceleis]MCX7468606.1 LysR family transcriptional regulator [Corynebacterium pygosceleis]